MPSTLDSYNDESHTTATTFVVAGYVGSAADWRGLIFRWKRRLAREGVGEFHAVDCAQATRAFKGWAPDRRETLQSDLAQLLLNSGLVPVVTAIQLPGWPAVEDRIRAVRPRQRTPYHLGFEHQITLVSQQKLGGRRPIDFVFDQFAKHEGGAREVFESMKGETDPRFNFAKRLRSLDFADSSVQVGLQAADFLAYEAKRHLEVEWGQAPRKNRTQWFELLVSGLGARISDCVRFFDTRALEAYLDAAERSSSRGAHSP